MRDAARRAAAFIAAHAERLGELTWEHKGPADFVSDVDRGAEEIVRGVLLGAFPEAAFTGEETYDPAQALGDGLAFVVDPLDGTTNFLHGFPWYAVSIGALRGGALVAGVVHNVPAGDVCFAARGAGAWRARADGRLERLAVSRNTDPARALVGTGFPFKHLAHLDAYQRQFAEITGKTAGIRRAGSAALDLCDVACGRFDAFWEHTLAPWDVAAGLLLVREAGGLATDLHGDDAPVAHTPVLAGSPAMHAWLLDVVQRNS
ncbi:inositol monophosphatase family protein [Roseisolibacter sp. H3M3-2]|uniref:inositol monophosphatase family protein n=1 Tax=Roseisolibacter sp. H3M3-2 TaxID=3031323 RepID=UPI0023DA7453|nr:inositol monophosphatase family protein [Roseisolibacter sp. H3M3-2]MDF1503308.1 inositol monophosphatase family protein [Roseisolibacter sp. H3M3-2]